MKPTKDLVAEFNTKTIRDNPNAARVYIEELHESKQELLDALENLLSAYNADLSFDERIQARRAALTIIELYRGAQ